MKALLNRLHAKLGDFWWYSLMLFCACRAADCLNVFVGLWLVPKYVPPSELGAVMPLTQFANFLVIPIGVFASTFRNELNALAVERKFGQMKTLMRGVFIATAVILFLAIVLSRLLLPAYLERIRIAEGSLGFVIIIASFIGAVNPIFTTPLQALKKLKANAVISLIGAPIRLLAMLVTMPLRALTGYFVGQAAPPTFGTLAAVFALRKELSVPAEPYWNRGKIKRFAKFIAIFGLSSLAGGLATLIENTVLRQRLPELDSAAYYMITRFSDIAGFLGNTLAFTIFPFTANLAAQGKDTRPLILKSSAAVLISNFALAIFFLVFGETILLHLPHGKEYAAYSWAIPWMITIPTMTWIVSLYTGAELSAFRFGYMKWTIPLSLAYPALMLLVSGYGYFTGFMPSSWVEFLRHHNICSLGTMLCWMTGYGLIRTAFCLFFLSRTPQKFSHSSNGFAHEVPIVQG